MNINRWSPLISILGFKMQEHIGAVIGPILIVFKNNGQYVYLDDILKYNNRNFV